MPAILNSSNKNNDYKSILNEWNNFLVENKLEEELSLKIEKIQNAGYNLDYAGKS